MDKAKERISKYSECRTGRQNKNIEMRQSGINYREGRSKICLPSVPEEESKRELGNWQYLKKNFPEILKDNNL